MSVSNEVLKNINSLSIIQNQIDLLKLKTKNCLQLSINGGIFDISPQLISHVQLYLNGGAENAIFLDKNDNPIKIEDLEYFLEKMLEREYEVLNEYYIEFEKLKQLKSPNDWLNDD